MARGKNSLRMMIGLSCMISLAISCKKAKDDDKPESILPTVADKEAPLFVVEPRVESTDRSSATLSFGLNERGSVVVKLTSELGLALSPNELVQTAGTEGTQVLQLVPQLRKVVRFDQLSPGTTYRVLFVARDSELNLQSETKSIPFSTLSDKVEVAFLNVPEEAASHNRLWEFRPELSIPSAVLELKNAPSWLSWNQRDKLVSGLPDDAAATEGAFSFQLVLNSEEYSGQASFQVPVASDPLFSQAWHLENTGQKTFTWFSGAAGIDINLKPAYSYGLTGKGINVRLIGTGLQIDHPDLAANVDEQMSMNFAQDGWGGCAECAPNDPSPQALPGRGGDRDTAVAGIIAAVGWNGIGSRGIAPEAKLGGYNILASGAVMESDPGIPGNEDEGRGNGESLAVAALNFTKAEINVLNFGSELVYLTRQPAPKNLDYAATLEAEIRSGRQGKGGIFIKPAGEGHLKRQDANLDTYSSYPYTIVVGSVNSAGFKSSNSLAGSNLWISAPGGELGFQSQPEAAKEYLKRLQIDQPLRTEDFLPGLLSTDASSIEQPCQWGFAKKSSFFTAPDLSFDPETEEMPYVALEQLYQMYALGGSGFNLGRHPLNPNCDYTATSHEPSYSAAGVVAGVVALMLERNPELGWRDVKHILAMTARRIDESRPAEVIKIKDKTFERLPAWRQNAAGFYFHNYYGFGLIDAAAAIEMADPLTYEELAPVALAEGIYRSENGGLSIPEASASGTQPDRIIVPETYIVESLRLQIDISHESMSHIGIYLESPSGTGSTLLPVENGALYPFERTATFLTNAFYGEPAKGVWTLRVFDGKVGRPAGSVTSWQLQFTGREIQ